MTEPPSLDKEEPLADGRARARPGDNWQGLRTLPRLGFPTIRSGTMLGFVPTILRRVLGTSDDRKFSIFVHN